MRLDGNEFHNFDVDSPLADIFRLMIAVLPPDVHLLIANSTSRTAAFIERDAEEGAKPRLVPYRKEYGFMMPLSILDAAQKISFFMSSDEGARRFRTLIKRVRNGEQQGNRSLN